MYRSENDEGSERTAFRKAEKKYKIYYVNAKKKKIVRPVDLSEVVDFKSISEKYKSNGGELEDGVSLLGCDFDRPIFCLKGRPGFYFIPGALSLEEQCHWIKESLNIFPQPPNRTNHNAIYGSIENLFVSAKEGKLLVTQAGISDDVSVVQSTESSPQWKFVEESHGVECKSVAASVLLRKLRWSTLGLQFNWSMRSYDISLPHRKIPDDLCQLAKRMAAPVMPCGEEFKPEAAIVNYFGISDMLGGHLDDMEKDWSKPIVSMSLGCKAIFLLGGKSREDPPVAMFLRSGDVVLMSGEARECFHGVPRIFVDEENADISQLEAQFSREEEDGLAYLNYIRTSRININIRQVF